MEPETRNQKTESILIVKPSSLGDIVHTLPAVAAIKENRPEARIRWIVNTEWAPLLEGNPHVDEIVDFPRRDFRGLAGSLRILPWARKLRARIDAGLVLDFQGLLRSALISKLCRGQGGRIIGLSDAREGARFFYDESVDVAGCRHAVDRYLALLQPLGIERPAQLSWPLPEGNAPAGFSADVPFVVLHPFSRGKDKSLSIADVEEFCRAIAPMRVVLLGRTEEHMPPLENVTDLLNRTTIPELIWVLRRASYVVSVDSGPMHIASALTSRLVAIHTWSDPAKVGPYNPKAWIWKDATRFKMETFDTRMPLPDMRRLARLIIEETSPNSQE